MIRYIILLFVVFLISCNNPADSVNYPLIDPAQPAYDPIILVDRTGKEWDITHAVMRYGFEENNFRYGLGPRAMLPIQDPAFISHGAPGYPASGETFSVIGVNLNSDIRAYPLYTLYHHEVANDRFGDQYVAVTFCPLKPLTAVYSRMLNDQGSFNLNFAPSGWVYNSLFILHDYETESLWYPFIEEEVLRCISGTLADYELPLLDSQEIPWNEWRQMYPSSKVLKKP